MEGPVSQLHIYSFYNNLEVGGLGFLPYSDLVDGLRSMCQAAKADLPSAAQHQTQPWLCPVPIHRLSLETC